MDLGVPYPVFVKFLFEGLPVDGFVQCLAYHDSDFARSSDREVGVIVFRVVVEHPAKAERRLLGRGGALDNFEAFLKQTVAQVPVDLGHVGLTGAELGQAGGLFQYPSITHFRVVGVNAPVAVRESQ